MPKAKSMFSKTEKALISLVLTMLVVIVNIPIIWMYTDIVVTSIAYVIVVATFFGLFILFTKLD